MLMTAFRVRLADGESATGYKTGYIGTVVGEDMVQVQGADGNPKAQKIYLVLWYNVNEETGDETISQQPAPASHLPQELRAHVDPDEWATDEDWDEDEDTEPLSTNDVAGDIGPISVS